jgi:phage terminase large subunit-like protein
MGSIVNRSRKQVGLEQDLSASSIASLTLSQRTKLIDSLTEEQADQLLHDWSFLARADQLPPPDPWQQWLYLAGRGAGKTRAGVEWCCHKVKAGCGYGALVAPTAAAARDVMVEGPAGVMEHCWEHDHSYDGTFLGRPTYEPSKRRLPWQNGAYATLFSGEESDRLRGPQHDFLWADELAAWWHPQEAWDMAMFGLRMGKNPQAFISTTPRPIPIIRELMRSPTCVVTQASTFANRPNLARAF